MKRARRVLGAMLMLSMLLCMFAGCSKKGENDNTPTPVPTEAGQPAPEVKKALYQSLDPNISGEIDIMVWSGDSIYYEDIGKKNWTQDDVSTQNVAAVYAMAKKFNQMYPNVKINLWAKADDPHSNDTTWAQELENFKAQYGKYPDIYASTDLVGDTSRGMVADLSVFSDDTLYQSFNQPIMKTMEYYGVQAGLPQFSQPWGVYVNKELAENNNIEVPDSDWTIAEYTEFVSAADGSDGFWGAMDTPLSFIATGTKTINYQMSNYSGTGDRVNLTSDEVVSLLSYIPEWAKSAIWVQNGLQKVPSGIMDDGWWWGYRFFCRNYVLTYDGDPWMIGSAGLPKNEDGTFPSNAVESADWDIYPRPSTPYQGNTVGICVDPMAVHNYAMDDGNPAWSDTEKAQLTLAYAFGSYWCGATESMQARADMKYKETTAEGVVTYRSSLNDSFPLVTGSAFDDQMKIWYSTDTHKRYADAELMPGFQYVIKLWEESKFWDISDKTYPYTIMEDGAQKTCLYEWLNATQEAVAGVGSAAPNWMDNVKARLADWNTAINARFVIAETGLKEGLKQYYGLTDADFR